MPSIELVTEIAAPVERVFDLARSIDLHQASAAHTQERAVAGVTSGLIGPGEEVTWSARHFGIRQELTGLITDYERPYRFVDIMTKGAFRRLEHEHTFESTPTGTRMRDRFDFEAPFGPLGRMAEAVFLTRYMRGFLEARNAVLKRVAESDDWPRYLGG